MRAVPQAASEGANWTPSRWHHGIRRLEHADCRDLADRAWEMPNLLPPRPGGTLAAIAACPKAHVVFVRTSALDTILSIGDVWRRFPVDQVIRARWWRMPFDQVPCGADREAQVQWQYDWWERIDSWITENRPGGARSRRWRLYPRPTRRSAAVSAGAGVDHPRLVGH